MWYEKGFELVNLRIEVGVFNMICCGGVGGFLHFGVEMCILYDFYWGILVWFEEGFFFN